MVGLNTDQSRFTTDFAERAVAFVRAAHPRHQRKLHLPHGYRSMKGCQPGAGGKPGRYDCGCKTGLELYDLSADVGEAHDVAAAHPGMVARLRRLAEEHRKLPRRPAGKAAREGR